MLFTSLYDGLEVRRTVLFVSLYDGLPVRRTCYLLLCTTDFQSVEDVIDQRDGLEVRRTCWCFRVARPQWPLGECSGTARCEQG